jgi:signal transduction histidine kinase
MSAPSPSPGDEQQAQLSSYRSRAVVVTAAAATLAALALLLVAQVAYEDTSAAAVQRVLHTRAAGVVAEARGLSRGPRPVVRDLPEGAVLYDAAGRRVAGTPPAQLGGTYASLARSRGRIVRAETEDLGRVEVMVRRFALPSGATGVVVVTEPLDPYTDEQHEALLIAAVAGVVIVVLTTLAAAWATRRVLAPVASMARTAEQWSEHDLDRRFDLGPPRNEVQALGRTLDGLLDKVAGTILAEQRLTSELAHELRTPLTTVAGTAELLAQRADLDEGLRADVEEIRAACRSMSATITGLLEVARAPVHGTTELAATVADVVRGLGGQTRVRVDVDPVLVAAAPELAARALSPVLDNALRRADHVTVRAELQGDRVHVVVSDDGPGTDGHEVRAGLGLPLARRVARSLGGDVRLRPGGPGATFEVVLPLA